MKRVSLSILFFLLTLSLYSQNYDSLKGLWDKLIISDSYGGWSHFNNHFEVKRINEELFLTNGRDSIISKIDKSVLDKFFESLASEKEFLKDPLRIFGKDSIWLADNAEKLWFSYLSDKNEPPEVDSFAIRIIKDYNKVKRFVWSIQGTPWTDDYPYISVSIIKNSDTLIVQSFGQYPFMMPWSVGGKAIYNSGISTSLSEILPSNMKSNKSRLNGNKFDYYLIDRIYTSFIDNYRNYIVTKIKYPKQFNILEKQYRINNARLAYMASIEWGGFLGAQCLELGLNSKSLPDNISYSVIYGRRIKLHSVKPLIRKEDKIISLLSNNRVYQYTSKNSRARGEIHFVNSKSLSGEAKRSFMSDLKDNGIKKSIFRGRFRHATFYELTEYRENIRSFSRWIFLKDGTNILWEFNGDFLMDLSPEIILEKGYICQIVTDKDWEK